MCCPQCKKTHFDTNSKDIYENYEGVWLEGATCVNCRKEATLKELVEEWEKNNAI
jgi:hypothetical protein